MKDYNEDYYLLFANPDCEEYDIEPDETQQSGTMTLQSLILGMEFI